MKKGWTHTRAMLAATLAGLVGACGGVVVKPEPVLPKPLVAQIDADVGLIAPADMRKYVDKETRFGTDWEIVVGPGETRMMQDLFRDLFRHVQDLADLDAGRAAKGLQAIFEPRIEQFSFANAKETGGVYCAVTIRYNIGIYAPDGSLVDNLTLTGYGSGPAPKIGNGEEELAIAAYAAMRDAAAKFLTQFPGLDIAKPLLASHPIEPRAQPIPGSTETVASAPEMTIETVPINDPPVVSTATPSSQAPSSRPGSAAPVPAPNPDCVPAISTGRTLTTVPRTERFTCPTEPTA